MKQARPDSTLLPTLQIKAPRTHDDARERDICITRMLAPSTLKPAMTADPVHTLIERHCEARAACLGLDDGKDEEAFNDAHDRRRQALEQVEAARPSTLPGLFALASHMDAYLRADADGEDYLEPTSSGQALAALMGACLGLQKHSGTSHTACLLPVDSQTDPVFKAIDSHVAALATFSDATTQAAAASRSAMGRAMSAAQRRDALKIYRQQADALVNVRPTSPEGLLAFTTYLASHDNAAFDPALESWELAKAIRTIAAAVQTMLPEALVSGTPEAQQPRAADHTTVEAHIAFIDAASGMLDHDLVTEIWARAREIHPVAFADGGAS